MIINAALYLTNRKAKNMLSTPMNGIFWGLDNCRQRQNSFKQWSMESGSHFSFKNDERFLGVCVVLCRFPTCMEIPNLLISWGASDKNFPIGLVVKGNLNNRRINEQDYISIDTCFIYLLFLYYIIFCFV